MQIQSKLDTLNQLADSPEVSKLLGKSGEQGRITGIILYYKNKYPEMSHIFNNILEEIETEKNVE